MTEFKTELRLFWRHYLPWIAMLAICGLVMFRYVQHVQQMPIKDPSNAMATVSGVSDASLTELQTQIDHPESADAKRVAQKQLRLAKKVAGTIKRRQRVAFTRATAEYKAYLDTIPDMQNADTLDFQYLAAHHLGYYSKFEAHKPALYQFKEIVWQPGISLIIVALLSLTMIFSTQRKRRQLTVLAVLPMRRGRLALNQLAALLLNGIVVVVVSLGLSLLLMTAIEGFGALAYPVRMELNNQAVLISIGKLLGQYLLLLVAWLAFIAGVTQLCRRFTAQPLLPVGLMLIVILLSQSSLLNTANFPNLALVLPSSYVNLYWVLFQHAPGLITGNAVLEPVPAAMLLCAYAAIFLIIAYVPRLRMRHKQ